MAITYTNFPLLLFLSYDKDTAPEGLPFEVLEPSALTFLQSASGLHDIFSYIGAKNSLGKGPGHTNYRLTDALFHQINSDDHFRGTHFSGFLSRYVKPTTGLIIFREDGQYVYMLLGKHETKELKKADGRHIATAFFKENVFIGFEEAIITEKGLEVWHTGYYSNDMELAGYLSFVAIFLSYLQSMKNLPLLNQEENTTKEAIYSVY